MHNKQVRSYYNLYMINYTVATNSHARSINILNVASSIYRDSPAQYIIFHATLYHHRLQSTLETPVLILRQNMSR